MKILQKLLVLTTTLLAMTVAQTGSTNENTGKAIFAGGCFWCVETDFDSVPGVLATISGYTGGTTDNPTYKNHTAARHREAVEITFDPSVVSYEQLVEIFWTSVDPTDGGGQFCDRGFSYSTAIYTLDDEQHAIAEQSKSALQSSGQLKDPVATPIERASTFWPAETYHQDYYKKNPLRYRFYRRSCGRDKAVKAVWGKMAHAGLKK